MKRAAEPVDPARVSVVIPVHNGARLLAPTLQSIAAGCVRPGEVIVVDDGSHDDSAAVARANGATVLSQPQRGPGAARNAGTAAASGDVIAFLDADDLWTPEKLAVQLQALGAARERAFSFTDFRVFDEHGVVRGQRGLRGHPTFRQTPKHRAGTGCFKLAAGRRPVLAHNYILPSSVVVHRRDFEAAGGFDESIAIGLEDYEFFLRLFAVVPAIAVMQPLLWYRRHGAQLTAKSVRMKLGFFDVQARIAEAPGRYPAADARLLLRSTPAAYRRVAFEHLRAGEFSDAARNYEHSLSAAPTLRARIGLRGAQLAASPAGSAAFGAARSLWRARPKRR